MGFMFLPIAALSFFIALIAIEQNHSTSIAPMQKQVQAEIAGETFVAYRNAVMVYQQLNPSFTGTVSNAALAAQSNTFSAEFLSQASNAITNVGTSGKVITSFATLPSGALKAALNKTDNDWSFGVSANTNWTSAAPNANPVPLATTVPTGSVVSVIQIGN